MGKTTINTPSVPKLVHRICLSVCLSSGSRQLATCSWQLAISARVRATQSKRIHIRNISDDLKINIGPNNWKSHPLHVCSSVCPSICLSVCLSVCLTGQPIYLLTRGQCSQFFDCLTNWLTPHCPSATPLASLACELQSLPAAYLSVCLSVCPFVELACMFGFCWK